MDMHEWLAQKGAQGRKANYIRYLQAQGFEIPKFKLAENLTNTQAYELEERLIETLGRYPNGPLLNAKSGGRTPRGFSGWAHTDESRVKISAANSGKVRSDEARAKVAAAKLGTKASAETRAKLSEARRKNPGVPHTDAAKKKISEKAKGRVMSLETRAKISAAGLGRQFSSERNAGISARQLGRALSPETKAKISAARKGKSRGSHSLETREKIRLSLLRRHRGA